jgi:phosphomannomutase
MSNRSDTWRSMMTTAVVVGATLLVLSTLHPELILRNNTPTGGDMGAHVWGPAYLRDVLLPHWRFNGWSMDWYSGFPAYRFYMVVPALMVVLVDIIVPYGIAFKIVVVAGLVAFPFCAWLMGRLARLAFPLPELMAVGATMFLYDESFTIYGGNIASTMAGEYSFSLALAFALVAFGLFARGLETGQYRAWTAVAIALSALCHGIVLIFVFGGLVIMWFMRMDRQRFRYGVTTMVCAVLLSAFWVLPFLGGHAFMTDMKYEPKPAGPNESLWTMFFPLPIAWDVIILALAIAGFVGSLLRRRFLGIWMGVYTIILMVGVNVAQRQLPVIGLLWNPRLLPFVYLLRFMLALIGVYEVASFVHRSFVLERRAREDVATQSSVVGFPTAAATALLGVSALFCLIVLGFRYEQLPGGKVETKNGKTHYTWGPVSVPASRAFSDGWARWNFEGYEGKAAYGEYHDIVQTMLAIGDDPAHGCGRALWENNSELNKYGTTMSLMLLPFWTKGCIGSMEGLFFEAAGTTPYHFITAAAMSKQSSNPVRELRYDNTVAEKGVPYLRELGVKYYMAFTPEAVAQADAQEDLVKLKTSGPWHVYEVRDVALVEGLSTQPVIVNEHEGDAREQWLELGTSYFQQRNEWAALPAADGPASWQRIDVEVDMERREGEPGESGRRVDIVVPSQATPIELRDVGEVSVSNIDIDQERLSFDVDNVGTPVLVRVSYFPNWKVKGAEGPYRVAPNMMVVIPSSTTVVMEYATSRADQIAFVLTLAGLVMLVWFRRRPFRYGVGVDDVPLTTGGGSVASDGVTTIDPMVLDRIVKAYDVRGTTPNQMNEDVAYALGVGFAQFTDASTVLVARDMRLTGEGLADAFAQGAMSRGVNIVDLGLASTDLLYFAAGKLDAPGAMFTASHNPAEYNGIKFCLSGARPVGIDSGLADIRDIAKMAMTSPRTAVRGMKTTRSMLDEFADHVVSFADPAALRGLKVVADTANGMGGLIVPVVFERLAGVQLEVMYGELDGSFPNHPADPIQPANQRDLQARVVSGGFDVGLAFDGDADRVFVVDELGRGLSGSTTTAMLAAAMLRAHPGATILHNCICSRAVAEVIRENGGTPVRTRVGHSFIKQEMAETGAVFGGEHSAHYYFLDNYRADSGIIASMLVLNEMARAGVPLSEVRKPFERYEASGEINTEVDDTTAVIESVARAFAQYPQDTLDGLTVDCGEWWFNLRPSNTEPLLRLNLEAPTRVECDQRVAEVLGIVAG